MKNKKIVISALFTFLIFTLFIIFGSSPKPGDDSKMDTFKRKIAIDREWNTQSWTCFGYDVLIKLKSNSMSYQTRHNDQEDIMLYNLLPSYGVLPGPID